MDAIHSKEESTRLRTQIGDLRGKLNDLENKVSDPPVDAVSEL